MNHSNEDHLLRLHAYLQKNVRDRPGMNIIKTGILSCCRTEYLGNKFDQNKMCFHCFHHWTEGDFSLKFRSKNSKRKNHVKLYNWKMKCSNCGKQTSFTREKVLPKFFQSNRKKVISTDAKSQSDRKKKGFKNLQTLQRQVKNYEVLSQTRKQKKESKKLIFKKKSRLSYLKDFL